ncbi:MAG: hypothetical protein LBI53_00945 [Candidatus Peribacteria bacterium]|nr:hypothetical protein [Candidatus Peribacteria bacterium]
MAGTGSASYGKKFQRGNNYGRYDIPATSITQVSNPIRPFSNPVFITPLGNLLDDDRATPQNDNLR